MAKRGFSPYVVGWAFPDTTERFFPTGGPILCNSVKYMRAALDVFQCTGNVTIYPAVQTSDDPDSWGGVTSFARVTSLSATSDGISYSTGADTDASSILQSRYFREGFTVKGDVGNSVLRMVMVATNFAKRSA